MEEIITATVGVLLRGGTVLYPTDTIWGIGCDARNAAAVERLYAIKERDRSKSMLVLIGDNQNHLNIPNTTIIPDGRPTTYILPRAVWHDAMHLAVADNLPADDGSLGIRVPDHRFCQEVIRRLGAPLVSTSANLSGHPSPHEYSEIEEALKSRVDYCVPPLPRLLSSETRGSPILRLAADGSLAVIRH